MSSSSEFSYDELDEFDVALLPERETMFGSASAYASAGAAGFFAHTHTYTNAQVVQIGPFYAIANSDSASSATAF
jgi:hypothetical protein